MICTEEEAMNKWCPMVRFTGMPDELTDNRGEFQVGNPCACIGSRCMAWREYLTREEAENGYFAKNGYCGLLAGKP